MKTRKKTMNSQKLKKKLITLEGSEDVKNSLRNAGRLIRSGRPMNACGNTKKKKHVRLKSKGRLSWKIREGRLIGKLR